MVLRRGILGGIALVGAGVAVFLIVSRSGQPHRELGNPGSVSPNQTKVAALAPDTSHETGSRGDGVKAETASTRLEEGWTVRGRLLRYPDPEALEPTVPAAGALLRLRLAEDTEQPTPDYATREVRSGPDGRYEIAGVPGKREYRLLVDFEGCALRAFTFELPELVDPGTKVLHDIVLEDSEQLVVTVEGPRKQLLSGATVNAWSEWNPRRRYEAPVLSADSIQAEPRGEGEYVFERLPAGTVRVEATLPGLARDGAQCRLPRSEPLELVLRKGESISGVVRTTAGEPIAGARVRESEEEDEVRSDERGSFRLQGLFSLPFCVIEASAEGFCDVRTTVQGSEADIVLPRESTLSGRVLSASGREPIPGARVKRSEDGDEVVTDGSGAFTLKRVPPGVHEIRVEHALYLPLLSGPWELGEGEQVADLELAMEPGLTARGKVLSGATGDPVGGAKVSFQWFPESTEVERRETLCDGSGRFELGGLRDAEYFVEVSASGFAETGPRSRLSPTAQDEWTFTIDPEAVIHGRVLDPDGKPVPGALVHVTFRGKHAPKAFGKTWDRTARTDSRGAYEFSRVPRHDDYCLVAEMDERLALAWVEGVAVDPGDRQEIDIRFPRGGIVRGRVSTTSSSGPGEVTVTAFWRGDGLESPIPGGLHFPSLSRWSLEAANPLPSGDFELKNLPRGKYAVLVSSTCCLSKEFSVELEEASERFLDVHLETGFSVSGKVVDSAGKPVEGVHLTAWLPGENAFATSDEDGLFIASGLPSGRGAISAFLHGVESTVPCDIPSSGNVVTLGKPASVSGRVEAPGRKAAPECEIEFLRWAGGELEEEHSLETDEASRFQALLAPGRYLARATAEGFASSLLELELRRGEKREIALELYRAGSVEARVELEGAEASGGWLYLKSHGPMPAFSEAWSQGDTTTFEAVPPGRSTLVAVVDDKGIARKEGLLVTAESVTRVELKVPGIQGIFGRILRRGEPLDGATVRLSGQAGSRVEQTSAGGWYQIEGLPPGEHDIEVNGSIWTERVLEGKASRLDIDLAAALVSGSVRIGGKPAVGVSVDAASLLNGSEVSTRTNASGEWSLDLLAPGEYSIKAWGAWHHLVLREGQDEATVTFELEGPPLEDEDEDDPPEDEDEQEAPGDED